MELKHDSTQAKEITPLVLIVPSGIETMEMAGGGADTDVLIVPSGIETQ